MSRKFFWTSVGIIVIAFVVVGSVFIYFKKPNSILGIESHEVIKTYSDIVGTRAVTSTTGVAFSITGTGGISASTSYISKIGGDKENALYMFKPTYSSSTALLQFDIWGSSDDLCYEATTTAGTNLPLTSEINWYSAGDHLQNRSHLSNLLNDSSTSFVSWSNPTSTAPAEILLTNLNYECLKLDVAGSSTVLYAGLRIK